MTVARMRLRCCLALALVLLLAACGATPAPPPTQAPAVPTSAPGFSGTLTVFAAASLTASFAELGHAFEAANPGSKVVFNFAGSQDLRTQLEQGARADIFASADAKNMEQAREKNLIGGEARTFARNRLIIIAPRDNKAGVKEPQDLAKTGLKLDIADASVPVGSYTLQMLDKLAADAAYGAGFKTKVLANVVSKENNVKQVVSKVVLGEADAGVVYSTDAQADAAKLTAIAIPDPFNVIATYPIALVKGAGNAPAAQAFIDLLMSPPGQAILAKYGFAAP